MVRKSIICKWLMLGFFGFSISMFILDRVLIERETLTSNKNLSNTKDLIEIPVLFQFISNKTTKREFELKLYNLLHSIISQTECKLKFYVICDDDGKKIVEKYIKQFAISYANNKISLNIYDVNKVTEKLKTVIHSIQLISTHDQSYYSKSLFVIPASIHRVLDHNVSQIIMLDVDMKLYTDIKHLYSLFQFMTPVQLMGLALEQQPVYWHLLTEFREKRKQKLFGGAPPNGYTGFNSGVKLMNLDAMRKNKLYNKYLDSSFKLSQLAGKYFFKGHLGDQDFFTLLSFDFSYMFYILPCRWNRQLCQWWRHNGYQDVFDLYFRCSPPYLILHGNCGTKIEENA